MNDSSTYQAAVEVFLSICDLRPEDQSKALEGLQADPEVRALVEAMLAKDQQNCGQPASPDAGSPLPPVGLAELDFASEAESPAVLQIPGYELQVPIGKGAMGEVWRALQKSTNRLVALKVLFPARFGTEVLRRRFQREVELAARLEHPHIARIYDSDVDAATPYYVMELIDGLPLYQWAQGHCSTPVQVVALVRQICQAVAFAHRQGVIHRDLKPSNILVKPDGTPVIVDFGLAKQVVPEDVDPLLLSLPGQVLGTPAYMAPEQAGSRGGEMDTPVDVYSLGIILHELLLGINPRDLSGSPQEVIQRVADGTMPALSESLDPELKAIVAKALQPKPEDRYATAGELGAALDRYLQGTSSTEDRRRLVTRRSMALVSVVSILLWTVATGQFLNVAQLVATNLVGKAGSGSAKQTASSEGASGTRGDSPGVDPGAKLIAHWKFDAPSGAVVRNRAGEASHATLMRNATWTTPGAPTAEENPRCLLLTGQAYVVANDVDTRPTDQFSIMLWVRTDQLDQQHKYLVSRYDARTTQSTLVAIVYGNSLPRTIEFAPKRFTGEDPRPGSGLRLPDEEWHHIAYTYDGTTFSGYLDGVPQFQTGRQFQLDSTSGQWFFGTRHAQYPHSFHGQIDDIRIYNRALPVAEIRRLFPPTLIAHWRLDEGKGTAAFDSGPSHNTATLKHDAGWAANGPPIPDVSGAASLALRKDGDYMVAEDEGVRPRDEFTVALWLRADDIGQRYTYVVARNDDNELNESALMGVLFGHVPWTLEFTAADCKGDDPRPFSRIEIQDDAWHHLVYTYDGRTFRGYLDGVEQCQADIQFQLDTSDGFWFFGTRNSRFPKSFLGQLDDVRVYDQGLSAEQVRHVMRDARGCP